MLQQHARTHWHRRMADTNAQKQGSIITRKTVMTQSHMLLSESQLSSPKKHPLEQALVSLQAHSRRYLNLALLFLADHPDPKHARVLVAHGTQHSPGPRQGRRAPSPDLEHNRISPCSADSLSACSSIAPHRFCYFCNLSKSAETLLKSTNPILDPSFGTACDKLSSISFKFPIEWPHLRFNAENAVHYQPH